MKSLLTKQGHSKMSIVKSMLLLFFTIISLNLNAQERGTNSKRNNLYQPIRFDVGDVSLFVDNRKRVSDYRLEINADDVDLEYITNNFYPEIKGKVKSIGNTSFEYYTGDFYPEIKGNLKSIGNVAINYYTGDFYPEIKGKIKSIGDVTIEYYTGDFYPEIKGLIKSIGSTTFEYYTGDFYPEIKGKLKSIKGNKGKRTFTIPLN